MIGARRVAAAICVCALGCDAGTTTVVSWGYRFGDAGDRSRATLIAARVLEGGCDSSEVLFESSFVHPDGRGPAPPVLDAGAFGFEVRAVTDECATIALGCRDVELPGPMLTTVMVDLVHHDEPSRCPGRRCTSTICEAPRPDGAIDLDAGSSECTADRVDCNANPADGCEADLANDPLNCGRCAGLCPRPNHATPGCAARVCGIGDCEGGYDDCDLEVANGCEQSLDTMDHCGACDTPCAPANGVGRCNGGLCELLSCNTNFYDCDGLVSNGCESEGECVCSAGMTCTFTCTTPCRVRCEAGTECALICENGAACEIDCAPGTTCRLECNDAGASKSCEEGCATAPSCHRECPSACD